MECVCPIILVHVIRTILVLTVQIGHAMVLVVQILVFVLVMDNVSATTPVHVTIILTDLSVNFKNLDIVLEFHPQILPVAVVMAIA